MEERWRADADRGGGTVEGAVEGQAVDGGGGGTGASLPARGAKEFADLGACLAADTCEMGRGSVLGRLAVSARPSVVGALSGGITAGGAAVLLVGASGVEQPATARTLAQRRALLYEFAQLKIDGSHQVVAVHHPHDVQILSAGVGLRRSWRSVDGPTDFP